MLLGLWALPFGFILSYKPCNKDKKYASSTTATPNATALSSLLPALSPAKTLVVFLETLPDTLAPNASSRCAISSRLMPKLPVITQVSPANGKDWPLVPVPANARLPTTVFPPRRCCAPKQKMPR